MARPPPLDVLLTPAAPRPEPREPETPMIDLHYWTTPNGHKVTMFLEETGLPYRIVPVRIGEGEQFARSSSRSPRTTASLPWSTTSRREAASRSRSSNPARCCSTSPRRPAASSERRARPRRGAAMAVLADGRARSDGRAEPPFLATTRPRRSAMRSTATSRRRTGSTGCSKAPRRPRIHRRRTTHRRHGDLSLDRAA